MKSATTTTLTAAALFAEAWSDTSRTPRSPEYRAGMLAHLRYQLLETDACQCPHRAGTASYDAWYAGIEESWRHLADHRVPLRTTLPHAA